MIKTVAKNEATIHGMSHSVKTLRLSSPTAAATVKKASIMTGLANGSMSHLVVNGEKMLANTCNVKCLYGKHMKKKTIPGR